MSDSRPVYLLPGLRSPFAKIDRDLSGLDTLQLSVPVVQQTVVGAGGPGPDRLRDVDQVVWGAVIPTLAVSNWAREVWLDAGLDPHVPAVTVIQQCGTSLAAATHAAAQVHFGRIHLALCGGAESMSSTQIGLSKQLSRGIRRASSAKGAKGVLHAIRRVRFRDVRLAIPAIKERTTGKSMGEHTEDMARDWGIGREEQDRLAAETPQPRTWPVSSQSSAAGMELSPQATPRR
jgi:acetyl-CoA C-acetyltransferase